MVCIILAEPGNRQCHLPSAFRTGGKYLLLRLHKMIQTEIQWNSYPHPSHPPSGIIPSSCRDSTNPYELSKRFLLLSEFPRGDFQMGFFLNLSVVPMQVRV